MVTQIMLLISYPLISSHTSFEQRGAIQLWNWRSMVMDTNGVDLAGLGYILLALALYQNTQVLACIFFGWNGFGAPWIRVERNRVPSCAQDTNMKFMRPPELTVTLLYLEGLWFMIDERWEKYILL
jgi:hypothetical protein